ncbi:CPBP family intramembrane metalloprotease, partial [bacterium]|nr:CPBP family intramembrane metalloprotease [bacterium]
LLAPFVEEVIYRGYIFEKLAAVLGRGRGKTAAVPILLAMILTSALWAWQHSGLIDPDWVKWVQIFGVGIALGIARVRCGLEMCILIHLVYNAVGILFVPPNFWG